MMMRSRDEIESQLSDCRKRLKDEFFGGTLEHLRYYRSRVDFLEWVLGMDAPLMRLPQPQPHFGAKHAVEVISAKKAPARSGKTRER